MQIKIDTDDIQTVAAAVAAGLTTLEQVVAWIDDEEIAAIVDEKLVLHPGKWQANDGNAEITVDAESSHEAADLYVDGGDWGEQAETAWVNVSVWRMGVDKWGDVVRVSYDRHKIEIEPTEPECSSDDGHDWQDYGDPHGHGGGIVYSMTCRHCGCRKTIDTWAQDMTNGEQGLSSVSYDNGDE